MTSTSIPSVSPTGVIPPTRTSIYIPSGVWSRVWVHSKAHVTYNSAYTAPCLAAPSPPSDCGGPYDGTDVGPLGTSADNGDLRVSVYFESADGVTPLGFGIPSSGDGFNIVVSATGPGYIWVERHGIDVAYQGVNAYFASGEVTVSADGWNYVPPNDLPADDQSIDCHLANSGNCALYPANADQLQHARDEIARMRDEGICGQIKAKATQVVENGLMMWDDPVRQNGALLAGDLAWRFVGPTGTERVSVMHLWSDPRYFNGASIAHEAMHALDESWTHAPGPETYLLGPDGAQRSFDGMAHYCARY